jgi:uncharacterized protein (TIGR00369 family)
MRALAALLSIDDEDRCGATMGLRVDHLGRPAPGAGCTFAPSASATPATPATPATWPMSVAKWCTAVIPGRAGDTLVLPGDARHVGDHDRALLHGGVIAAFLESAALLSLWASGARRASTIECTSDFLRPAPVADLAAGVTVVRRGRRVAHLRMDAWRDDRSRPVAVAHGAWLV